ncbi:MAG: hypothetical protein GY800_09005 [Planctomycetes bacterium]|nr:hypothetical protein [Planctomycetota bacterium]
MTEAAEEIGTELGESVNPLEELFNSQAEKEEPEPKQEEVPVEKQEEEPAKEPEQAEPVHGEEKEETDTNKTLQDKINTLTFALQDEMNRKRTAQEELSKYKHPKQQEEPKEFNWDDPNKAIDDKLAAQEAKFQDQIYNMSEANARRSYADYDEKYETFKGMIPQNKNLVEQMLKSGDPAEFLYHTAKNYSDTEEITKDPAAYKEKLKAEILAELKGEQAPAVEKKQSPNLPPSGANFKGSGNPKEEPIDDDPLGSLKFEL